MANIRKKFLLIFYCVVGLQDGNQVMQEIGSSRGQDLVINSPKLWQKSLARSLERAESMLREGTSLFSGLTVLEGKTMAIVVQNNS
jgi:hypothetical protein